MIDENGICSHCGQIVKRNRETGKRYTKEEIDTINQKKKESIIKFEPKGINIKKTIDKETNKKEL